MGGAAVGRAQGRRPGQGRGRGSLLGAPAHTIRFQERMFSAENGK